MLTFFSGLSLVHAQSLASIETDDDNILYVNQAVTGGTGSGNSWTNAIPELRDALTWAQDWDAATEGVLQIWVASGTYLPVAVANPAAVTLPEREATFQLKNGVAIYGGFVGTETTLAERDWVANTTILSGDINSSGNQTNNSFSVVTGSGTNDTAVIDGFTITAGNAISLLGDNISPFQAGGGLYNSNGSPSISNCTIIGNAAGRGGGMVNVSNSNPIITNSTFSGNTGSRGGGMYNRDSNPTIINSTFLGNSGSLRGGGIKNNESSSVIINSTFSGNLAGLEGGGIYNLSSTPTLTNSIIWNNSAGGSTISASASVFNSLSTPTYSYSLIANSNGSGGGWVTALGTDNGNNIDADPLFVDPQAPGLSTGGDYRLEFSSPAVNAGLNSANSTLTDLDGNPRVINDTIDMGAYENQVVCPSGNVLFVASSATGANTGDSWTDAFTDLQDALNSVCSGITEIWVAAGIYLPVVVADPAAVTVAEREATFQLKNGVAIYGGFVGTETTIAERDWVANETILSGDINGSGDLTNNSFSVVTGSDIDATAVIDGFIITAGNANIESLGRGPTANGAGMFIDNGSPTIMNCTFSGNSAMSNAGGLFNYYSSPTITNSTFSGNSATRGGGMHNHTSFPTITSSTFSENIAGDGGGLFNEFFSAPTIVNSIFSGNRATRNGGGGILESESSSVIINTIFTGNMTDEIGGGIYIDTSNPTITNSTFTGNIASLDGGGIFTADYSEPIITNSIIWNNSARGSTTTASASIYNFESTSTLSYSLIANSNGSGDSWVESLGTDNGNNLDADPLFVDPLAPGLSTGGDYRLLLGSPAIDAGLNSANSTSIDLDGNPRVMNDTIDMGAYENQVVCPAGNVQFVASSATGANTGDSWTNAFTDLQDALNSICPGITEIWVAAGTYLPVVVADPAAVTVSEREATFQLKNGLAIYGGFVGTETTLAERDWVVNETILSGDINGSGDLTNNSYTVVTGSGTDATAVIDGFTITMGNADVSGIFTNPNHLGGGMYNNAGSPTVKNNTFSGNSARTGGGGMYNSNSSSPEITNSIFFGNTANGGGGMYNSNSSSPEITNSIFFGNTAVGSGGGMVNLSSSSPTLTNVTISGNLSGSSGGGMRNIDSSSPTVTNSIIWNNSADGSTTTTSSSMANGSSSTPEISYSLIANSNGSGGSWVTSFGTDNGNNIDADPLFADPQAPGLSTEGDYRLQFGSPAINAGLNSANSTLTDLDGNPRVFNDTIDLGAYESAHDILSVTITGSAGWRMMGAPVTGMTVAHLSGQNLVQGIPGLPYDGFMPNVYMWDPAAETGDPENPLGSYVTPENGAAVMPPGTGFIWYMWGPESNPEVPESKPFPLDIETAGMPLTGDASLGVLPEGWNMIANPFEQSIAFNELTDGTDLLNVPGFVWNPNEGELGSHVLTTSLELDNILSLWQGVFINLPAATEVVVPQSAKRAGGTFLNDAPSNEQSISGQIEFMLEGLENGNLVRDRAAILYFHEQATTEWDNWDVIKLSPLSHSWATASFVGERNGENVLKAQHSLPYALQGSHEIPMDIQLQNSSGNFRLSWPVVFNVPEDVEVFLHDTETGEQYNLSHNGHVDFTMEDPNKGETEVPPLFTQPEIKTMVSKNGHQRFVLIVNSLSTGADTEPELPTEVTLSQNYPNPFNPTTQINYALPEASEVRLDVFNVMGQRVATLVNAHQNAGNHTISFNARNLATGVYIYRLTTGNVVQTRKMLLVK